MKSYELTLKSRIKLAWYKYFRPLRIFINTHIKRLHLLDMRNVMHGYDGGYMDPAEQLLYANFAILKRFVEKEKPFELFGLQIINGKVESKDQFSREHDTHYQELYDLYMWWTVGRKNERDAVDLINTKVQYRSEPVEVDPVHGQLYQIKWTGPFDEWVEASNKLEERDDEMLNRLVKIRKQLWT